MVVSSNTNVMLVEVISTSTNVMLVVPNTHVLPVVIPMELYVSILDSWTCSLLQVSEYEHMTKDVNRSAYTRKILEIVSNIKKQKNDIDKVWKMFGRCKIPKRTWTKLIP